MHMSVRVETLLYEETGKRNLFEQQHKHQNHNGLKNMSLKLEKLKRYLSDEQKAD